MTKYRIFSLIAAALAVGVGFVYLLLGETSLTFVLPLLAICFWLITLLSYWEARKAGIKAVGIGVPAKQVDATSRGIINAAGYGDYFTHGTGHGVGIEIHEDPYNNQTSSAILAEGNIVTVEPGIYLPGKYGVRLEDTMAVTKTGAKILTKK